MKITPPVLSKKEDHLAIHVRDLSVSFGQNHIMRGLDLDVRRGEIIGVVGASGTGKTVLLRAILGLVAKQSGSVDLFGQPFCRLEGEARTKISRRMGVLFQYGALFSSLNVCQNIQVPLREFLSISQDLMDDIAALRLAMVGLDASAAHKQTSELSGGMIKRVALARALALDPDLVFLDEPTSGLDPVGSAEFDALIAHLRDSLGLTVFMVTHDLDSLFSVCDRIAVLGDKKVLINGTLEEVKAFDHPWIKEYFLEGRARFRRDNVLQKR